MSKPLTQQLREAADWCAGEQAHTPYSDAEYIRLFREAAEQIELHELQARDATAALDEARACLNPPQT